MTTRDRIFYLHINSEDCTPQGALNTQLQIKINPTIKTRDENHYFLVSLANIQVPYSMYNINPKSNFFTIIETKGMTTYPQLTLTIPSGSYNAIQLANKLTEILDTNSQDNGKYSVTYSKITGKFTYALLDGNRTATLGFPNDTSAFIQMGFDVGETALITSTTPKVSTNVINVNDFESIFLRTDLTSINTLDSVDPSVAQGNSGTAQSDILQKIDIRVPFTGIIFKNEGDTIQQNFVTNQEIGILNIRLTNKYNQLLNLNGLEWLFSLKFEEINKQTYLPEFENRRVIVSPEIRQLASQIELPKRTETLRIPVEDNQLQTEKLEQNLQKYNLL
jgi:hypothetical protein